MADNVRQKINIALVEYINRNLGDTVIAECAYYFLEKALEQSGIKDYCIQEYNMYSEDMEIIRCADLVIFAGGGLIKYKRERFYRYVPDIIETTEKYGIPVYFNCTGVEGYDETDERCVRLKRAVNCTCVKGITVRDDFDTFTKHYIDNKKDWLDKVLDPAAFASEVYCCRKKEGTIKIGIGICRNGLFQDYGAFSVTKQFQLNFWKKIIDGLKQQGYEWEIFTNGLYDDCVFANEILEYSGIYDKEKHLVRRPAEGKELAETISGYQGIIACRLHANIIAFSEGVPSVGLVWNDKMLSWGRTIGYPERFIEVKRLEAEYVLKTLKKAMEEGCRNCTLSEREQILRPLQQFIKKYGNPPHGRNHLCLNGDKWEDILLANALGGKNFQYCGMNSPETIMEKYEDGFRWFEADVKLTTDGRLVCVNGWTPSSYNKLGKKYMDKSAASHGICYQDFMESKYYDGHYPVMDYVMLLDRFKNMKDARLILDARNHAYGDMLKIAELIRESICRQSCLKNRLIIRIMDKNGIEAIRDLDLDVMYDIPAGTEREELGMDDFDIDNNCKEGIVKWISVRKELCCAERMEHLKKYRKKICLFTYNSISEIKKVLPFEVDLIATDYLSVKGLNNLTE